MKKTSCVAFVLMFFLPIFLFGQGMPGGGQQNGQKPTVQVLQVKETLEYDTAYYGARVEPINSSNLIIPFGGTILQVFVKEGDTVARDAPLYSIVRTTQGSTGDYIPLTVRALIPGIVSDVTIHAGDELRDGTATMTVADITSLRSIISVSDKDVSYMSRGLICTIKDLPGVSGKISKISVLPDSKTALFAVEVIFNPSKLIFPGKFVTLQVPVNPVQGTFIPSVAIVSRYSKKFVWIINEQKTASMAEIILVNMKGDVSLVTGLKSGQHIAVSNTRFLTQGTEVNPVYLKSMAEVK